MSGNKLLILNMNDVVRESRSGKFVNGPFDVRLIRGVRREIRRWHKAGWTIVGVTNQGGVMHDHKTLGAAIGEERRTLFLARYLERIYMCHNEGSSALVVKPNLYGVIRQPVEPLYDTQHSYRKPGPGMLVAALDWYSAQIPREEMFECIMVGVRDVDQQAAEAANVEYLWVEDWMDSEELI